VRRWLRRHGHHLVFGLCLASLALLLGWWTVFIRRAVLQEYDFHIANLKSEGRALALQIGHTRAGEPALGTYAGDDRFEIVPTDEEEHAGTIAFRLSPWWSDYTLRPRPAYLQEVEDRFRSRIFMVLGEGAFLAFLVLVSSFMLYRLIRLERRSAMELHEFWGRITHEIKTPITGIKTFLQTLKTHRLSEEELRPLVDLALDQVERQQQLAHNILIGQRLERDMIGLNLEPVELGGFLRKFLEGHGVNLAGREVRLSFACPEDVAVLADPDAVHIILDNLVDNAIKYGGEALVLDIEVECDDDHAFIAFTDNGPGLDPRMVRNIFEAYRRLTDELPAGSHGTGMGLYISRKLARKMGGELTAFSEGPGRGTRFQLRLRRARPTEA
jgi:signal transduction histidine kinase